MPYGKTVVKYDGTNLGPIYLKDIGQRNGLGGGRSIYIPGQDQYIDWNTDTTFISTSEVMLSYTKGVLHDLASRGVVHVTIVAD